MFPVFRRGKGGEAGKVENNQIGPDFLLTPATLDRGAGDAEVCLQIENARYGCMKHEQLSTPADKKRL